MPFGLPKLKHLASTERLTRADPASEASPTRAPSSSPAASQARQSSANLTGLLQAPAPTIPPNENLQPPSRLQKIRAKSSRRLKELFHVGRPEKTSAAESSQAPVIPVPVASNFTQQRIDKESMAGQIYAHTRIFAQGGATYELLGTLNEDDQRELEEQHGVVQEGRVTLGQGFSGKVRLAKRVDSFESKGQIVAVKKQIFEGTAVKEYDEAISIGPHPNLVQTLDIALSQGKNRQNKAYIFMEYFPSHDGEVEQQSMPRRLKDPETASVAKEELKSKSGQMLDALLYIHSKGKFHCDVKGKNFLFGKNGTVKICDFATVSASAPPEHFKSDEVRLGMTLLLLSEENYREKKFRVTDQSGATLDLTSKELIQMRDKIDRSALSGDSIDDVIAALLVGASLAEVRAFSFYQGQEAAA